MTPIFINLWVVCTVNCMTRKWTKDHRYLSPQLILQQSSRSARCWWRCRWTLPLVRWAGGSRRASPRSPSCSRSSPTRPRPPCPPASSSRAGILQNTDDGCSVAVQELWASGRVRRPLPQAEAASTTSSCSRLASPLLCLQVSLPACVHHLCTARGWIRFPQQEFNQFRFRAQSSMGLSVCTACIEYAHLPRQPVPHDMATQKVKGYISPFLCTLPLRSHNTMRLMKSQIVHTALQVEPDNFNTISPSLTRNRSGSLTRSLFATLFIFPIIWPANQACTKKYI